MTPEQARSVIHNPRFAVPGGFTIRRYTVSVDDDGMSTKTQQDIHAEGAIVPYGSLGVTRSDASEFQASSIEIYTDTSIQTGKASTNVLADNVIYNGQLYEVTSQDDYSQWGFNAASAVLSSPGGEAA